MIEIVASHGLDYRLQRHGSALGVGHALRKSLLWQTAQQRQVPFADRSKRIQRAGCVISGILLRPRGLVERLNHVVWLRQRLTDAESEYHFRVSQMRKNFPRVPFSRRPGPLG